jgi:uncharacterized protein (DUF4415 family)
MRRLTKRERFATRNKLVTIYVERAVLAAVFATGNGRQTQVNALLLQAVVSGKM